MCLGSFIHGKLISTAVSHFFGCSLQRCIKKKNTLTKHISPLVANIFILRFTILKYLGEFSGFFFVSNEFNSVFVAVVACAEGEIVNVCVAFLTAPKSR